MAESLPTLDFSRFQFLTFDCYGTLIDWESGLFSALKPILDAHARVVDDAQILQLYGELEVEAEKLPFQPYRDVLRSVVRGLGQKLGFTPSIAEEESLPESMRHWAPWADSVPALKKLQSKYKLAIISNVDDDLFASAARQLRVKFDHVITAQQAECYKPGLSIFQLALDRMGIGSGQLLHVGQSIYHDVIPAQKLGMATVWVNRPSARPGVGAVVAASAKPDLEVRNLLALASHAL